MYYVLSDLHGCYDLYAAMLDKINFSERDTLFFLGDAADRGPDGIEIMEDLRSRPNVVYLLGNHEDMFRRTARGWGKKLSRQDLEAWERTYRNWTERNGGQVTWEAWFRLPEERRNSLLEWMEKLPWYYEIALNGRAFLLAHAGVGRYQKEKRPEDCVLHDFIWERMDYSKTYYRDKYLVTGHTPTWFIDPGLNHRIYTENNHIAIDCGAVYTGILGCICLDSLEQFYVN